MAALKEKLPWASAHMSETATGDAWLIEDQTCFFVLDQVRWDLKLSVQEIPSSRAWTALVDFFEAKMQQQLSFSTVTGILSNLPGRAFEKSQFQPIAFWIKTFHLWSLSPDRVLARVLCLFGSVFCLPLPTDKAPRSIYPSCNPSYYHSWRRHQDNWTPSLLEGAVCLCKAKENCGLLKTVCHHIT